jgi:hypothetical protein
LSPRLASDIRCVLEDYGITNRRSGCTGWYGRCLWRDAIGRGCSWSEHAKERGYGPPGIAARIEEDLGDPVQVAAVAVILLGCGEGSWNQVPQSGLHKVALDLLKVVDQSARGSALESVAADPNGWEGAVRWLLYHNGFDNVPTTVLSRHIERAFRHALSHPREFNRRHVMALLGNGDGPFVIKMRGKS